LLVLAVWLTLRLAGLLVAILRFINGDETALSRYFDRNRERKGFNALSEGMMALASGEARLAMTKAAKAEKYLGRPELTNILAAQAAEQVGDKRKAEEVYRQLLTDDRTRFVGVHGLLKQKLAEGDTETALKLAEKAFTLKPRHVETQDALLRLQSTSENWEGARKTLSAKLKHGSMPRDVHKRRDAVLILQEARDARTAGRIDDAQSLAIEANRLSPALVPAATMAARAYIEQGRPRYATRVLKTAWDLEPHPELAAEFAAIAPDESPGERIKRFLALTRLNPDHRETRMLLAELNLAAEDFVAARKALGDLAEVDPTVRSLTLMAAIERGEGADDRVVRGWLAKAVTAPRDPLWICEVCGAQYTDWRAVCDECGGMDTLTWKRPPAAEITALPQMMPLLEDRSTPEVEAVDDTEVEVLAADEDGSAPSPESSEQELKA
ncbi:MAG: heme biosynthesis HemY N-terminal domain-containing protein, partial [Pseudomonadota bacterium]